MQRGARVLRSTVSQFFPPFTIVVNVTCDVQSTLRFLNAKNFRQTEIHRQSVQVYGERAMNEGDVRKWCRLFKEGKTVLSGRATYFHKHIFKCKLLKADKIRFWSHVKYELLFDTWGKNKIVSLHTIKVGARRAFILNLSTRLR
jgi:hypothetical protein